MKINPCIGGSSAADSQLTAKLFWTISITKKYLQLGLRITRVLFAQNQYNNHYKHKK